MAKKKFSPEQVVSKLRQIDVLMGGGKTLARAAGSPGSNAAASRKLTELIVSPALPTMVRNVAHAVARTVVRLGAVRMARRAHRDGAE